MDRSSMANKHKILSILLIIREMKIINHKEISPDTTSSKNLQTINAGKGMEKREYFGLLVEM